MINYCAGFLFKGHFTEVLLVRKARPEWQAGKLNAIGGKVENDESLGEAMQREFAEETGLVITRWKPVCSLLGSKPGPDNWLVGFFAADLDNIEPEERGLTLSDEPVNWYALCPGDDWMPNLRWLIPMAINILTDLERTSWFYIQEQYE